METKKVKITVQELMTIEVEVEVPVNGKYDAVEAFEQAYGQGGAREYDPYFDYDNMEIEDI